VARVVIVSNRVSPASGAQSNQGGLAIAMQATLDRDRAMWFGWSGEVVDSSPGPPRLSHEGRTTRALLDLPRDDYERYYGGFSNRALWPLFHYRIDLSDFDYEDYAGYRRVNEEFARNLVPLLNPDDVIWVHDYHLIPLGEFLRGHGVSQKIGFFLHTPFPVPEILTTLPVHEDLVRALTAYDLVGFQTENDLRAFMDYVRREAHGEVRADGHFSAYGRKSQAASFPIGIDPDRTAERARQSAESQRSRRLRDSLAGRKLVIGVDRLDYSKGLLNRFKAVQLLLEEHPEHRRGAVVLQIAPPTRGDVPEYRLLRSALDGLMGHINGRFGEPDLLPVRYLNRHFSQDTLFGYYRLSAVGLVTPLRDGMNLVAKEFVASQDPEKPGVLILSRFAGAAQQLTAAVTVNPYDPRAIAAALDRALIMPLEERRERYAALMKVLRAHDLKSWRDSFLAMLTRPGTAPRGRAAASSQLLVRDDTGPLATGWERGPRA
jgi:trehalose 6-phosphate synthase